MLAEMLFSVEQAFVGRDERRAPLKTPVWEASFFYVSLHSRLPRSLYVLHLPSPSQSMHFRQETRLDHVPEMHSPRGIMRPRN